MGKDRYVVFQFDHDIERTVRRQQREQRNSKTISGMDNLQDVGNLDPHGPLQPVNIKKSKMNMLTRDSQAITTLFTWLMTWTELLEIMLY